MANEENLIPFNEMTEKEQRKIASKGGKASAKARAERKLIAEQMKLLLSLPLKDEKAKAKLESLGIDADNIDNQMAMIISMWNKAIKGDVQAFNSIRDTVGEKPKDDVDVTVKNSKKFKDVVEQIGGEGLDE